MEKDEIKDDNINIEPEKPRKQSKAKASKADSEIRDPESQVKKVSSRKTKSVGTKKKKKKTTSTSKKTKLVQPQSTGHAEVQALKVEVLSHSGVSNSGASSLPQLEEAPATKNFQSGKVQVAPLIGSTRIDPVQNIVLPIAAIKVRNVVAKVINLTTEIIPSKVIVQGIVHEQLFFVGTDGIVHHLADDIHFSTFLDIPGVVSGMNAEVSALVEEVITELAPDGLSIEKKIILEIFVKVTETVQLNLATGTGLILFLKEVVGENTGQTLVETDVTLFTPAIKVDEIIGMIRDLETDIIPDKVIIQGTLHKQIFFVDTNNLGRHQAEDVHFSLFIDLPGAMPGMDVEIDSRIEAIFFNLLNPTTIRQKVVMEFFVKVTQNIQQEVQLGNGPLLKGEEFIGENTIQNLTETLVTLFRPAIKVREIIAQIRDLVTHVINNKVIVQGTIHKQIFFIGTDNIEYHQAEDVPFGIFLDIPGVTDGDLVHLNTQIEAIFFELTNETELRQKVIIAVTAIVTREVQLNLVLGIGPLVKIEQVIGENTKQVLIIRTEVIPTPSPPLPPTVTEVTVVTPGGVVFGQQQIILNNTIQLPETAIKVKEINAIITNLSAKVITDGVIVEGTVEKTVIFVSTDNIVHSITEQIPFSILVSIPGISPNQAVEAVVEIEDITFSLNTSGTAVNQVVVLKATVESPAPPIENFTVVTDVTGPGITTTKVLVEGLVLTPSGAVFEQFEVVTDVTGPGIISVTKQVVLLQKVGEPAPSPLEVVTNVQFA